MKARHLCMLVVLFGCPIVETDAPSKDSTDPDDSVPDTETDPGETDPSETDTDAPPDDLDCTPGAYTLPAPAPDTCVVQELTCGQVLEGTTTGGTTEFTRTQWEDAMCLDYLLLDPAHLDAPERVFSLQIPPRMFGSVTIESCARLDLRSVSTPTDCDTSPQNCSAASGDWDLATVNNLVGTNTGNRYEIIVDGYDGDEANFRLTVDCWN